MPSIFDSLDATPQAIPLSRLTASITNTLLAARDLSGVWVTAELSDVREAGGHCYMELIEKNEVGQTIAKLRATIWRNTYIQLRQKFYNVTQREITTGIKALIKGSAIHHSLYGLSFNIVDIDPSYTIGDLERLRREILIKLSKEGLAYKNKELSIPPAPQKIAVISAEGAAGYGDFINHLQGNSEGFVFYPCLFKCIMQGDRVSESIRHALQIIESTADMWDCVAIIRGGGATTDLNGFDDYELARAVATCGLPVIVGIGHERDRNVLDEIANTSLKTPTAVAGFFIDKAREALDKVMVCADAIRSFSAELLRGEERRLGMLQGFIPQLVINKVNDAKSRLKTISRLLPAFSEARIEREKIKIDGIKTLLAKLSKGHKDQELMKINNIIALLKNSSLNNIEKSKHKITALESLVEVLDPKSTLKRGYSITRINGRAVKSVDIIKPGDLLLTTLSDGEIKSRAVIDDLN